MKSFVQQVDIKFYVCYCTVVYVTYSRDSNSSSVLNRYEIQAYKFMPL